jgi:hypothetical protein
MSNPNCPPLIAPTIMLHIEKVLFLCVFLTYSCFGKKEDIEAVIRRDDHHPTASPSVREMFERRMANMKKSLERYTGIALPIMNHYAAFMRNQDCQPMCLSGELFLYPHNLLFQKHLLCKLEYNSYLFTRIYCKHQ